MIDNKYTDLAWEKGSDWIGNWSNNTVLYAGHYTSYWTNEDYCWAIVEDPIGFFVPNGFKEDDEHEKVFEDDLLFDTLYEAVDFVNTLDPQFTYSCVEWGEYQLEYLFEHYDTGVESSMEAYKAGVPLEDIIA